MAGKYERQTLRLGAGTYASELCFRAASLAKNAPQTKVTTTTRIRGHRNAFHRNVVAMPNVRLSRARLKRLDDDSTRFMRSSLPLHKSQSSMAPPQNTADRIASTHSPPVPIRFSRSTRYAFISPVWFGIQELGSQTTFPVTRLTRIWH